MTSNIERKGPAFPTLFFVMLSCAAIMMPALSQDSGETPGQIPDTAEIQYPAPVTLTNADIERFIAALTDLKTQGVRLAASGGNDPTGMMNMGNAMQANADALAILNKYGFDAFSFQSISYNVMMAYAAGEMENAGPEIDAARAQLQAMKGQLPAALYDMIEQKILGAQKIFAEQPPANIELVKPYKAQINAAVR